MLIRVLRKHDECMRILERAAPKIEGIVFNAWKTKGWDNTGIAAVLKEAAVPPDDSLRYTPFRTEAHSFDAHDACKTT